MSLAERLTRLSDVLVALSGSPIPTHLFQTLADLAPAAVPCDYLAVCLPTPEQPGYLMHSLAPLPSDVSARRWRPDEGLPGRTMRTGQAVVVEDLTLADGTGQLEDILVRAGLRAVLGVPVRRGVEVVGALLFASRTPAMYHSDDLQIAALVAAGLGSALESARAYQALADERSTLAAVLGSTSGNAVKYTPSGGRVTVSVAPARDASAATTPTVAIRVADTGLGIPARHLPHVFDKFYRVHDAATKDIPGTGLGLAIAKSIVESHGGRIAVESTEGAGSVFVVELPECRSVD